jgi:hypothetical protein
MLSLFFGFLVRCASSRRDLLLENLALRQQITVLQRKHPRAQISAPDKLFWVILRKLWSGWNDALTLVRRNSIRTDLYVCLVKTSSRSICTGTYCLQILVCGHELHQTRTPGDASKFIPGRLLAFAEYLCRRAKGLEKTKSRMLRTNTKKHLVAEPLLGVESDFTNRNVPTSGR